MKIQILAFGIAKDIVKGQSVEFEMANGNTIGSLKEALCLAYPDFAKLKSLAIAVNTEYRTDDFVVQESDEIVIIPPVSGG